MQVQEIILYGLFLTDRHALEAHRVLAVEAWARAHVLEAEQRFLLLAGGIKPALAGLFVVGIVAAMDGFELELRTQAPGRCTLQRQGLGVAGGTAAHVAAAGGFLVLPPRNPALAERGAPAHRGPRRAHLSRRPRRVVAGTLPGRGRSP